MILAEIQPDVSFKEKWKTIMATKKTETKKPTLKLGEKEYDIENISDEAKALIAQIRFMENKINNIKMEATVLQNSRQAAIAKLSSVLEDK